MRSNLAPLSGMAMFAVAFLVSYASGGSQVVSAAIALALAVGTGLILNNLFPYNADLSQYNHDARRRVKKVLKSVENIEKLAKQVKDGQAQKSLLAACKIIPQMLSQTQQRENVNFKLASTAANVQNYLTSVESALAVYLRIQKDPDLFSNAPQQLAAGREGFAGFEAFALQSIQQLNSGDTQGYAANLETLKPLSMPAIPQLSTTAR